MALSLPAASIAWKMSSTPQRSCAYSFSCSADSTLMPFLRNFFVSCAACGLVVGRLPNTKPLPWVMMYGFASVLNSLCMALYLSGKVCQNPVRGLRPDHGDEVFARGAADAGETPESHQQRL